MNDYWRKILDNEILTERDVARLLGLQPQSVRARRLRGAALPPCIRVPHLRGRRYLLADVIDWLQGYTEGQIRRGRPTKREQVRRQRLAGKGGSK